MPRFRSFRTRLLVFILALTGTAQLAAFFIVARVHRTEAQREIRQQLDVAAQQFARVVSQRMADLQRSGAALSFGAGGLGSALAAGSDAATLRSGLMSFRGRVDAGLAALLSLQGEVLAETRDGRPATAVYQPLHQQADQSEEARATGYGVIDGTLHSLAVVPLRSPDIVAWVVIGFQLDREFLTGLRQATGVEITLHHSGRTLASTVTRPTRFITTTLTLPTAGGEPATLLLQYSLDEKLAPAERLEGMLVGIFAGSLLLAALLALWVARNVSQPVRELAAHTQRVAAGDYAARLHLARDDELGRLATAFNDMSAGLAERDRVRDLLDKNVSPEVAAQLMRDGAALGGEEREVTILFADLRGFTTMSEKFTPHDLLTLLNRYLERMSREIEPRGGIIDKFIGDAIMAVFGAPVAQSDAADRALATALAMERALAELNRELVAEGHAPLGVGIGVNTARVIAGNVGSERRRNYSVIGDGVNVAARLQSLTRTPEYRTSIITSAATLGAVRDRTRFATRPLGSVQVKGRNEPVEIFAVESAAERD